jgi:hypothetical protein
MIGTAVEVGGQCTEVFITEDIWRVVEFRYHSGSYMSIQHYCTAGMGDPPTKKGWVGMHYNWKSMKKPCYVCDNTPPEGIQGVFRMMNDC